MTSLVLLNYARGLAARLGQGGWRPYWGWGLGTILLLAVKFALIDAPKLQIALPSEYYNFLLGVLGIFVATFITREVGKHLERTAPPRPAHEDGGLVNNGALA